MFNRSEKKTSNINSFNLNFGPQHPAAHGVLRMVLSLEGERILNSDTHIGLLHRGTEYLITTKPFYLSLPYFDRLDYVSMLIQEHAYCICIEKVLSNFYLPTIIQKTRVILDELTRILNHLLAIACHALDVGSMSPLFWAFEERENIMEIYEYISGARMHAAFYRPLFFNKPIIPEVIAKLLYFNNNFAGSLFEINVVLTSNKV
jgi:NADH:ubiquinone oxidoreductase subunit D